MLEPYAHHVQVHWIAASGTKTGPFGTLLGIVLSQLEEYSCQCRCSLHSGKHLLKAHPVPSEAIKELIYLCDYWDKINILVCIQIYFSLKIPKTHEYILHLCTILFKNMLISDIKKYKFAQIASQSLIYTFCFLVCKLQKKRHSDVLNFIHTCYMSICIRKIDFCMIWNTFFSPEVPTENHGNWTDMSPNEW